jgi:hypothetical protein
VALPAELVVRDVGDSYGKMPQVTLTVAAR